MNNVLILGASGMLGSTLMRHLSEQPDLNVYGTIRSCNSLPYFKPKLRSKLLFDINMDSIDSLISVFNEIKPHIVVNCVGLVKQLSLSENPLITLPINSILPHRLAKICSSTNARLIHLSTDCVFSGTKGMYTEIDTPDASDLYGLSKRLGEVTCDNAITLRTSIIGHELSGQRSLVNWFLAQQGTVNGFSKAIFSGLPTIEISRILEKYIIPNPNLKGLYHVSADPIDKFSLLKLVAKIYNKNITIQEDTSLKIDRSLDSSIFRKETGYIPPSWPDLINDMFSFQKSNNMEID
jgi:dTDP-4-dehydrorhamnose reductase